MVDFLAEQGLHHNTYQNRWEDRLQVDRRSLDKAGRRTYFYRKYNAERAAAVRAAYEVTRGLRDALACVEAPQWWMVLTEDWCVDSAYSLPVIAAAAEHAAIRLRLVPRDEHLDVMDRYLTGGSRSIPKLVAFDRDGSELFRWGPRPAELQALRQERLAAGDDGRTVSQAVIAWYEAGGWRQVDPELTELLTAAVPCS